MLFLEAAVVKTASTITVTIFRNLKYRIGGVDSQTVRESKMQRKSEMERRENGYSDEKIEEDELQGKRRKGNVG